MDFDDRKAELDGPERDRAVGAARPRQPAADHEERVRRQRPAPAAARPGPTSELVDGGRRAIGDTADE